MQETIAGHLDGCERCVAILAELAVLSDPVLTKLRASPPSVTFSGTFPSTQPQPAFNDPAATQSTSGAERRGPMSSVPSLVSHSAEARYDLRHLHARGGLGEVHVAWDRELNREVALKRIRQERAGDGESRRRFLLEAEITGKLEHPGVVPVYGLGQNVAGEPCYAMRFIQGETLKDALDRFHASGQSAQAAGERSLLLRQLLNRFVAVCNTLAYAHSRGIVHRDLKPANILLGKYGETLVVDWGLAKPFVRTEAERSTGEETLAPTSGGTSSEGATQVGQALGTPAYMSPEQAEGRWGEVGPPSDLYSLGATLYTLLTGQAPFQGQSQQEVLAKARRGEVPPLHRVKAGVPRPLEAICLKAMALRPEDRYATALELAADVEHWLADEPVGAWREPWTLRARRWVRRHRTLATAAVTAVLLAILTGGIGYALVQQQQREQREQTAQSVNQGLGEATAFRQLARTLADQPEQAAPLWRDALAAAERAEHAVAGSGDASTRERVATLLQELRAEAAEAGKDRRMLQQLEKARNLQEVELQESDYARQGGAQPDFIVWGLAASPAYATAFREYGIDLEKLPTAAAAEHIRQRPIRRQLTEALDNWFTLDPSAAGGRLLDVSRGADADPLRAQVRTAISQKDRKTLKQLAKGPRATELPPQTLNLLAYMLLQEGLYAEAIQLMKRGQRAYPGDFWINDHLGVYLATIAPSEQGEASRCFAAAVALRPTSAVAWDNQPFHGDNLEYKS
jgi:tRNA A-37 threonylcarbamoyl transferase component Bud32